MMKKITGTINLDRVKEASSSSSDIYSLWVWKSPQAAAPAQESSPASITKTTNRPLPWHILLWSIGIHTVPLYQIHSHDGPLLRVKNNCTIISPLTFKTVLVIIKQSSQTFQFITFCYFSAESKRINIILPFKYSAQVSLFPPLWIVMFLRLDQTHFSWVDMV